jgi:ParB family chromosome partitioning protein
MLDSEEQISKAAEMIVRHNLSVLKTEELVYNMRNPVVRPATPARQVDPNVREAELELQRALGCRVRIKDRRGKGKIVIEYAQLDDFDRVMEALVGKGKK